MGLINGFKAESPFGNVTQRGAKSGSGPCWFLLLQASQEALAESSLACQEKEYVKKVGAGWKGRGETGAGSDDQTAKRKKWKEQMCFSESQQGKTGAERRMESKGPR